MSQPQEPPPQPLLMPHPDSIPKLLTRSFLVLSVPTDAWVQIYSDRIVFGVSQLDGKIGTYLLCEAVTSEANLRATEYHLSTLLGNREDSMLGVYARTLHERLRGPVQTQLSSSSSSSSSDNTAGGIPNKPSVILLGISLDKKKGTDPKMFTLLIDLLVDMYVDAIKE